MAGRLPPPPLVHADTHCLQTTPAPSDLHCHCCTAATFLVTWPPLPSLPRGRRCLPCRVAATAFLAARPPLLSLLRGHHCLPHRVVAAAFLATRPPLPSCLPCCAAADPSHEKRSVPPPARPSNASPDTSTTSFPPIPVTLTMTILPSNMQITAKMPAEAEMPVAATAAEMPATMPAAMLARTPAKMPAAMLAWTPARTPARKTSAKAPAKG